MQLRLWKNNRFNGVYYEKLLASAVAALALTVTANVASAEEQDVAKIKCSEFLQSGSTMPLLIMWIDGYLSAASDNTTMDDAYIEELGNKLGEFCGKNQNATLWDAISSLSDE